MTIRHYHERAMAKVDEAIAAKRGGDHHQAYLHYLEAITLEKQAIDAMTEESTAFTERILRESLASLIESANALNGSED